jgi:hypothetical protein
MAASNLTLSRVPTLEERRCRVSDSLDRAQAAIWLVDMTRSSEVDRKDARGGSQASRCISASALSRQTSMSISR